ncbi:AraC family transcriptional regulator [Streptomyces cucumeris]|uniref:AraC family transcriptional regulator n=1 Tax=Streptomyces TaxID=1883 RepID=UPI003D75252B
MADEFPASAESLPQPLPDERIACTSVRDLWLAILEDTGNPHAGVDFGIRRRPSALHVVGHLVMNCATLAEAAEVGIRYQSLVNEAGRFSLASERQYTRLLYEVPPVPVEPQQVEAGLAGIVTAARWVTGPGWAPGSVSFAHPCGGDPGHYAEVFGCPVLFERPRYEIVVPTADAHRRWNPTDPALTALHRRHADALLAQLRRQESAANRAKAILQTSDLRGIRAQDVAALLQISERTLRRALSDENTSWRELLDAVRHERTRELLSTTSWTLERIAHEAGMSGAASFVRAFTRWEGVSPGAYRREA